MAHRNCWCGNDQLDLFSDEYLLCKKCGTLVSQAGLDVEEIEVKNDDEDFYGKEYWLSHQTENYGFPDIYQRSRQDLPERCLHWLRTLLTYKLPPASILELGSAHGGFVALMRWAGFDATGLEMSSWVVNFAHKIFDIPMLHGPVEEQQLVEQSLDAIVLFDVLEHLPDPVATMKYCSSILKPDGFFIVQIPNYEEGKSYSELVEKNDIFLEQMKSIEHLHLFSHRSAQQFFELLGFPFLEFRQNLFPYDMFFVASRQPLKQHTQEQICDRLLSVPSGRLVQALLDQTDTLNQLQSSNQELQAFYQISEADRASRLTIIEKQGQDIVNLQGALHQTQTILNDYQSQLTQSVKGLQETHNRLQQALTKLDQTQTKLERSLERNQRLEGRLKNIKSRLDRARDAIKSLNSGIEAMQSSKFWKLREGWFILKHKLGLKTED